ncbi:MAG: hypothetical protein DRJ03_16210 [Chloroflexi bacterium]|nr:MAG: hypothetical protein DRJ03_16210 [Chloroflexota bacterium]
MNKTLQLIGVIAITLLSLFSMTSIAHAQGPEEYCALEQGTLPYQFIPPINNEPVESLTGWTGDFDGNGDACIGGITWSSGEFTKTIQPPDLPYYHGAALVSVTAWSQRANNSGWGRVTVTVGDAQQTPRWRWDGETLQTFSAVIAQGVTHNPTIHLAVDGVLCVDSISITPVDSVERSSDTLIDPDFEGIDWPAWSKVISSTSVENYGPRITDGWLTVNDPAHPLCTPISLGTYSDTIELQLTARKTDGDGAGLKAAIVADPADALTAIYGPRLEPPDQITRPLTMTARIATDDIADNYGEGYLCILEDGWVGAYSDGVYVYSIGATVCQNDECDTLYNPGFSGDIPIEPDPDGDDWFTPGVSVIPSFAVNGAAIVESDLVIAQRLTDTTNYSIYTVTLIARKSQASSYPLPLIVGIGDNLTDITNYPTDPPEDGQDYDFWDIDAALIYSDEMSVYTLTLQGDKFLSNLGRYLFISGGDMPHYGPGDAVEVDWICIEGYRESNCYDPIARFFAYEGTGEEGAGMLRYWTPVELDSLHSIGDWFGYTEYADMGTLVNAPDTDKLGGWYVQMPYSLTASAVNLMRIILGKYESIFNILSFRLDYILAGANGEASQNTASLKMPYRGLLDSVEVSVFYSTQGIPHGLSHRVDKLGLDVMANVDGVWTVAGSDTYETPQNVTDSWELATFEVALIPVETATDYIVSVTGYGYHPEPFFWPSFYVTNINTVGCYAGSIYSDDDCVVSDPDLDMSGGGPDSFYWSLGNYITGTGFATIGAENDGRIGQNVYAYPGEYKLDITIDSKSPTMCGVNIRGTTESGYFSGDTSEDFFNVPLECRAAMSETYQVQINVPTEPFIFLVEATQGVMDIHRLCLHNGTVRECINRNPLFEDGLNGYATLNGSMGLDGLVLDPGEQLNAIDVGYAGSNGPWQLTVVAQPVISGSVATYITPNQNPVYGNPDHYYQMISQTTALPYTIVKGNDEMAPMVLAGNGPSVINWDAADRLVISQYCITAITGTTWYGGKNCSTLINPDFDQGLLGWDSSGVTAVGGWVVFDSGGSVGQTVVAENLNSDPSFETGIDGWMSGYYNEIYSNNDQARTGDKSLVLEITSGTYGYAYKYFDIEPGTEGAEYTAQAWVNGEDTAEPDAISKIVIYEYIDSAFAGKVGYTNNVDLATGWQVVDLQYAIQNANTNRLRFLIYLFDDIDGILYVDDVLLVKGASIPVEYSTPQDATVHWIGRAPGSAVPNVQATVIVSSTAGVFTTTHTLEGALGGTEYFDPFEIGGDVAVTIIGDVGMELDYICLIPGHYDGPGDGPGGETPPIGEISANCAPPPMMVLSATIQSWMPSIWIWQDTPSNYETVSVYSAAWLRYIGCFLTGLGQMLETKLDEIILWLKALTALQAIDTLASLLNLIVELTALIEEGIDDIVDAIVGPVATVLYLIGVLGLVIAALAGLILLIIAVVSLIWLVPMDFWTGMQDALTSDALVTLPWPDSETHPLYFMIYGFQIFNETIGDTIIYPITIIVIIMGSIYVFLWTIKRFRIKI